MQATQDHPATDAELAQFNGTEIQPFEYHDAIRRQTQAYDCDDLQGCMAQHAPRILGMLDAGDYAGIGELIAADRVMCVKRRVSVELTGRVDGIKS